jgi:hypothetical protein
LYNLSGVKAVHFRLVPALRLSPSPLAIDTKMVFTVASLLLGIGQDKQKWLWLCYNQALDRKHAWNGMLQVCASPRGGLFRWPERAMDCNVPCSLIK